MSDRRVFFRFDDVGPLNRTTLRLVDLMESLGHPYVLAVMPKKLNGWMRRRLVQCRHAVFMQHGLSHRNHTPMPTKHTFPDEFPDCRGAAAIRNDLRLGRDLLQQLLGSAVVGYVPPWNRISPLALTTLEEEGYRTLSADALLDTSLRQLPVHVDVYSSYQPPTLRRIAEIQQAIDLTQVAVPWTGIVVHPLSLPRRNYGDLASLIEQNRERQVTHVEWKTSTAE